MRVGVFSCKPYERAFLEADNAHYGFELTCMDCALSSETVAVAEPFDAVSVFMDDVVDRPVIDALAECGVHHIALRGPGSNNVDLDYAKSRDIGVSRVARFSSASVAEHTVALILALNRKLYRAYNRVKENNFDLEGLLGFNLQYKTVGVVGTGRIGKALINMLSGFGCRVLGYDPDPKAHLDDGFCTYVDLDTLFAESDIVSLHCPLNESSRHVIDHRSLQKMRDGVMLINTCQGGLVNQKAVTAGLKSGKIGYYGLDVYDIRSEAAPMDDECEPISREDCERLTTFPNVLITGHQGFFTQESMQASSHTMLRNLQCFFAGKIDPETFL